MLYRTKKRRVYSWKFATLNFSYDIDWVNTENHHQNPPKCSPKQRPKRHPSDSRGGQAIHWALTRQDLLSATCLPACLLLSSSFLPVRFSRWAWDYIYRFRKFAGGCVSQDSFFGGFKVTNHLGKFTETTYDIPKRWHILFKGRSHCHQHHFFGLYNWISKSNRSRTRMNC